MRRILYIIIIIISLFPLKGRTQDYYANFNQYRLEGLIINPSFAGSREVLSTSFFYRQNWIGFKGAPSYQTISAHAPLKNYHVGAGFLFLHEQKDVTHSCDFFLNYAYRLNLGAGKISLGLKGGARLTTKNYDEIVTSPREPDDPVFATAENYMFPNFGFGFYYYTRNFFLGGSIPYFLTEEQTNEGKGVRLTHDFKRYNYFLNTGYRFGNFDNIRITPSIMLLYILDSPLQYESDISVEFLEDRFAVGTGYKAGGAILATFQIKANEQLRIGYTFDSFVGNTSHYFRPSHEIMLRYEFKYVIKASNPSAY